MNEDLTLSPEGERLIKQFESCMRRVGPDQFKAYFCPAGVLTIGWGTTNDGHGAAFDANTVWTQAQCDAAFASRLKIYEARVRALVTVPLTQHQYDALVSFAYNCGYGALARSALLRRLNAGDY
jgi:lysozyme